MTFVLTPARLEQRLRNVAAIAAHGRTPATHCKYRHEFTLESTYRRRDGRRMCRICNNDRAWYRYRGIGWLR